ncbi:MAG: sulfatase [Promethearchaeota archaeon]
MSAEEPMNFILIISDTLRRDFLSVYGNKWIHTEHIQRFAEKSLVFDNAYTASFPTVPNRRDVFTGAYTATYTAWSALSEWEPVTQQLLKQYNYTSMMVCDEPHILENGFHYDRDFDGFEWIRGQEGDRWKTAPRNPKVLAPPNKTRNIERMMKTHYIQRALWRYESDTFPARTATTAINWLEMNYDQGPFYLYIDFFDPHEPWDPPKWYVDLYDPDFVPGKDGDVIDYPLYEYWEKFMTKRELEHTRALYAGEVTLIDRWVGKIFEKIEDLGLLDNTMVIFTTDHGFLHGEHGIIGKSLIKSQTATGRLAYLPLFEEISHIPLIIHYPKGKTGRTDAMVQPPDFMPTIMDIIGHPFESVHGLSFKEVLTGKTDKHREFTLSFPYLRGRGIPITFVKDGYSAIFFSKSTKSKSPKEELDKAVDGVAKEQVSWEGARDLLFDLKKDPKQEKDIAEQYPDKMEEYKKLMLEFLDDLDVDDDIINAWRK